ncbi:hypothetical protein [Staphylococcus haemolyticus]|uniref:hypothetical protein n=1 Tax=Staphylococcus haemolyticus TaxID=1283 RepID=UPI001F0AE9E9|nr:hypothetical protein [Staphylococcus haemolyticus]MCH4489312.1 hypothetical protein [Staphylococcus haemolyticus]MDU0433887.1 hypothetical protein [Staphylococcus haemolyticus]
MVIKNVHVIFSDGDRHIYKEGDMKASKEFLEQSDINNHVIVTPEHLEQLERKSEAFDEVLVCAVGNAMDVGDEVNKIVEEYYKERGSDE